MSKARFSVQTAVAEGFDFWRLNSLKAAGPLSLAAAAMLFLAIATPPETLDSGTPLNLPAMGAILVYVLASVMAQGALFRAALAGHGAEASGPPGPYGLQWSGLEGRILGAIVTLALLFLTSAIVLTFVLSLFLLPFLGAAPPPGTTSEQLMASLSPTARLVFNVGLGVCLAVLAWLASRLSMMVPTAVVEQRIAVRGPFRLTRGAVLRIVAAGVVIYLPVIALQGLAWAFTVITGNATSGAWASGIASAISLFLYQPIFVGMMSYIYLRLRESEPA